MPLSSAAATPEGSTITDEAEVLSLREAPVASWQRWGGRPTLVAVAALNAITGLGAAWLLAPLSFGADADTFRRCALYLAEGRTGCDFPYPPLTALVARPLTWVSPTGAAVVMAMIGLAILLSVLVLETRGQAPIDRVLIGVAALGFAPIVYELLLGQTTLLIAAALYPVVRRTDSLLAGIPVGIALALAPKPMLLPVLVWMLVWRRRALTAALLTALALTCAGLVLVGMDQYRVWLSVATGFGHVSLSGDFSRGNFSLLSHGIDPTTLVLAAVVGAAALWAILRDASRGFVAALFASLLLAPYTLVYAASILLLAVKPGLAFAPRATRVLALVANPALLFLLALAPWSILGLAACVPLRSRRGAGASVGQP